MPNFQVPSSSNSQVQFEALKQLEQQMTDKEHLRSDKSNGKVLYSKGDVNKGHGKSLRMGGARRRRFKNAKLEVRDIIAKYLNDPDKADAIMSNVLTGSKRISTGKARFRIEAMTKNNLQEILKQADDVIELRQQVGEEISESYGDLTSTIKDLRSKNASSKLGLNSEKALMAFVMKHASEESIESTPELSEIQDFRNRLAENFREKTGDLTKDIKLTHQFAHTYGLDSQGVKAFIRRHASWSSVMATPELREDLTNFSIGNGTSARMNFLNASDEFDASQGDKKYELASEMFNEFCTGEFSNQNLAEPAEIYIGNQKADSSPHEQKLGNMNRALGKLLGTDPPPRNKTEFQQNVQNLKTDDSVSRNDVISLLGKEPVDIDWNVSKDDLLDQLTVDTIFTNTKRTVNGLVTLESLQPFTFENDQYDSALSNLETLNVKQDQQFSWKVRVSPKEAMLSGNGLLGSGVKEEIHSQLVDELKRPVKNHEDYPVSEMFIKDSNRVSSQIGGNQINSTTFPEQSARRSGAYKALTEICTYDGEVDVEMRDAVSRLAAQTSLAPLSIALGAGKGDPLPGEINGIKKSWNYSMQRDKNGDVTLRFQRFEDQAQSLLSMENGQGWLDPEQSWMKVEFSVKISKEQIDSGNFEDALEVSDVKYDAQLINADGPPEQAQGKRDLDV